MACLPFYIEFDLSPLEVAQDLFFSSKVVCAPTSPTMMPTNCVITICHQPRDHVYLIILIIQSPVQSVAYENAQ